MIFEHVGSTSRIVHAIQRVLEPLSARFGGDHLVREPLEALKAEGFEIDDLQRSKWAIVERALARKRA